MLAEQSPLFAGRGTNEAERLRGYILASFETAGLPPQAVAFVLEELETGHNPYTVAAAARALRGAAGVPPEAPALIVHALARLRGDDDVVSFERFTPASGSEAATTALAELARTLAFLGPRARSVLTGLQALLREEGDTFSPAVRDELARAVQALERPPDAGCACGCGEAGGESAPPPAVSSWAAAAQARLADLPLEDQDGRRLSFSEVFFGRPSALAFFYTRCANPDKCSLTVTRLARLARLRENEAVDATVAGITYDPGFDHQARLRTYGSDRGMVFSPRCLLARTVGALSPVQEAFDLGVGFGPVTVNRHRLDLVVLDPSLRVVQRFERRLWHEETVLDALRRETTSV